MNLTQIWLLVLTIFVASQTIGDLSRWSSVGHRLMQLELNRK